MEPIKGFFEEYRWLSNFWKADVEFESYIYPTVEHAYQAAKSFDERVRQRLCDSTIAAGQVKRMGRTFDLRPDWEGVKVDIMKQLLHSKFQNPELRAKLLETGTRPLEETNTWGDTYWGVFKGKGQNMLGKLLMGIRTELMEA